MFAGDTLYAEIEGAREARVEIAPERGHRHGATTGRNQDGDVVCTFERTILVAKRGHSVEDRIDY